MEGCWAADAPVERFGIFRVEFYCVRCDRRKAFQPFFFLLEMWRTEIERGRGKEEFREPTGIVQSISVLLEFDARICAIAEQRRIAGIARYRIGIQPRGSHKVVGYSDKAGQISGGQKGMQLDLPGSVHEKAWLASALSFAASCLSSSVISLGSTKLRVDSAGDGMTDEGGVVEDTERDDDSLMLTINTPQR